MPELLSIKPDDILVFSSSEVLSSEQFKVFRNNLRGNLEKAGIPNQKFIALDASTDLKVLRPDSMSSTAPIGFNMIDFDKCEAVYDADLLRSIRGKPCFIGITCNYGSVSIVALFPDIDGKTVTYTKEISGEFIDAITAEEMLRLNAMYEIKSIGTDIKHGSSLTHNLWEEKLPIHTINHNWSMVSSAIETLEEKLSNGAIIHDGSASYRMAFSNTVFMKDLLGNKMLSRQNQLGSIEFVSATLSAIYMLNLEREVS